MNLTEARDILGVNKESSPDEIRKQYKLKALKYHPDKNTSPDAADEFRKVYDAYQLLMSQESNYDKTSSPPSYKDLLFSFLKNVIIDSEKNNDKGGLPNFTSNKYKKQMTPEELQKEQVYQQTILFIVSYILKLCEEKAISYISNLSQKNLSKVIEILRKNREVFHIREEFLEKMTAILLKKEKEEDLTSTTSEYPITHCIMLNPNIQDLFEHNVYKYTIEGVKYIIPLWHPEVIFEKEDGAAIIIQCHPELPENIEINDKNDVIINLKLPIKDALNSGGACELNKYLGLENIAPIIFHPHLLKLTTEKQTIVLPKMGIPKVNEEEPFNVDESSDIILNIYLQA